MKNIFYIKIGEGDGMNAISLVKQPAVEYDFLKFAKNEKVNLSFNDEKHIISGVVCLADTPIYRYTPGYGEWYCIFEKETIKKMIIEYSKQGLWNSINLQHDDEAFVNGIYLIESYLKDSKRGIVPAEFSDIPDGSWIVSFYVDNEKLWNDIKNSGELNGFSLQGIFDVVPAEEEKEEIIEVEDGDLEKELDELLKSILAD